MERQMKRMFALAAAFVAFAGVAHSADPIVGNWKTEDGSTTAIASCGGSYCITVKTGKYAGRKIGTFSGKGESYAGRLTDPASNKTYDGTIALAGNTVKMKGCVMKVFCQSQTWSRL
jgi:uncharacterized protein (DUF2147 family)